MENYQKIQTPYPVIYRFDNGKIYRSSFLDTRYCAQVYGLEFHNLLLCKTYAPKASWDDATQAAQERHERLMSLDELEHYWKERESINAMMATFRKYGIRADNVHNGYHWAYADWSGPWKHSLCDGWRTPRFHEQIDHVRTVLCKP